MPKPRHPVTFDQPSGGDESAPKGSAAHDAWVKHVEDIKAKEVGHGPWTSPADSISGKDFKAIEASTAAPAAPAPSPWDALASSEVGQYQTAEGALSALAAGQTAPTTDANMGAGAAAMLGQGPGGPAAAYFAQAAGAAQGQAAASGLTGAEGNVEAAEKVSSGLEQQGLTNLGQAETAQAGGAEYQQLLQAMASEVPYHLTAGSIPALANAPEGVKEAENAAGVPNVFPKGQAPPLPNLTSTAGGMTAPPVTTTDNAASGNQI